MDVSYTTTRSGFHFFSFFLFCLALVYVYGSSSAVEWMMAGSAGREEKNFRPIVIVMGDDDPERRQEGRPTSLSK